MGQSITVFERRTSDPHRVRFEINRSLTGMAHHRYHEAPPHTAVRPPDELARRLFARGGVSAVHVYGNVIDVALEPGGDTEGIVDLIRDLYIHYREGVTPSYP